MWETNPLFSAVVALNNMLIQISMKYNFSYLMFYIELKYEKSVWAENKSVLI